MGRGLLPSHPQGMDSLLCGRDSARFGGVVSENGKAGKETGAGKSASRENRKQCLNEVTHNT